MKKSLTLLFVLVAVLVLGTAALADTYDISTGDILVEAQTSGKPLVTVGSGKAKEDGDGKVILTGKSSENTVTLVAEEANLSVTVKNLSISTQSNPPVYAENYSGHTVTLTFAGENTLTCAASSTAGIQLSEVTKPGISGTASFILDGKNSGSVKSSSGIFASGDYVKLTVQNIKVAGPIGAGSTSTANGIGEMIISNATVTGEVVEVMTGADADLIIKDSDVTVNGKTGLGVLAVATGSGTADITIENSHVKSSSGVVSGVGIALGAGYMGKTGSGNITLKGCKYKDPTHVTEQVTILSIGNVKGAATIIKGDETKTPISVTEIVKAGVPETGDNTPVLLMAGLLLLSGAALITLRKRAAR